MRNFIMFFIYLGLSFFIANFTNVPQQQLFFLLDVGINFIIVVIVSLGCFIAIPWFKGKILNPVKLILGFGLSFGIIVLISYIYAKVFNQSFYYAYEAVFLISCVISFIKRKINED